MEQLSVKELGEVAVTLEDVVDDYTTKITTSDDVIERKRLRTERKTPKQLLKQVYVWMKRKQKYEQDLEILGT